MYLITQIYSAMGVGVGLALQSYSQGFPPPHAEVITNVPNLVKLPADQMNGMTAKSFGLT